MDDADARVVGKLVQGAFARAQITEPIDHERGAQRGAGEVAPHEAARERLANDVTGDVEIEVASRHALAVDHQVVKPATLLVDEPLRSRARRVARAGLCEQLR